MTRPSRGVTLIELIVVMAIVAVLLSFVGPSVSAGIDNLVLTSESRRVISAFRSAQASARSTGERVFAVYDERNLRFMRGDRIYQTLTMPSGVRFAGATSAIAIVLLESGQIVGPDGIELINGRGRKVHLSIDHATGLVRLAGGPS